MSTTCVHLCLIFLCIICVYGEKFPDKFVGFDNIISNEEFLLRNRQSCRQGQSNPSNRVDTSDNLRRLRLRMKASSYDAYIIPTNDEHQSEYPAPYDERRHFITGFTGSAGTAVVLQTRAALWTDGRYFLQADQELDCNWLLMRTGNVGVPTIQEWLSMYLKSGSRVGADSKLISYSSWTETKESLEKSGIFFIEDNSNLIDDIWTIPQGRVPESIKHLFIHDIKYAGKSWEDKVSDLRAVLKITHRANGTIISTLDEISWLLNLRGNEVPYIPVFKSYAFVSETDIRLYIKSMKLTEEIWKHLKARNCNESNCIQVIEYSETFQDIAAVIENSQKILVSSTSSYAVVNLVPKDKRVLKERPSVVSALRVVKNPVEIQGMKNANIRDGVAIVDFIAMLEEQINAGKQWDEMKAASALTHFRKQQKLYHSDSFRAISASGSNGAVIHYTPHVSTNKTIDNEHMYLLDSGGQYLDGTTDITRTFHFGQPTAFEKEAYTRVLKGVIDLMTAVFPAGVRDVDLDILARLPLYKVGLNYLHGTGHGIGTFLHIHEAPIRIGSPVSGSKGFALAPGMFMSDEPGYYESGKFGIRLETVIMVVNAKTPHKFNDREYYTFAPVTFVPFEPKLIMFDLLSREQIDWLNDYNGKVRNTVGLELRRQKRERGLQWLLSKTELISIDDCGNHGEKLHHSSLLLLFTVFLCYLILC